MPTPSSAATADFSSASSTPSATAAADSSSSSSSSPSSSPPSRSNSEQHHQAIQQPQSLLLGSQPSCPEDYHPLSLSHVQTLRETTSAVANIDDTRDSTPSSPVSPQSGSDFRYDFHSDRPPSPPRLSPFSSAEIEMPPEALSPRSPSYTPMSPTGAVEFAESFDSSVSASRSTTMSPHPDSLDISTGFPSGDSNTASSPTPDDDDDEPKPMDVGDCEPGPSDPIQNISPWTSQGTHADLSNLDNFQDPTMVEDEWNEYSSQSPAISHGFTSMRAVPTSPSSYLRPGTRFTGTQTSERSIYNVDVEIKHVDMRESFLCGYLHIEGLTPDNPSICTYFEGEVIGPKYGFLTKHESWGADEGTDLSHWHKFEAFQPYYRHLKRGLVKDVDFSQKQNIFMRWKEHFLVPDHRKSSIPGASFEGFYYICFNQVTGGVTGIYFHHKSERFQQLELSHVENHGRLGAIEFR